MRLLFALFASAGMALATGFDGTWDATILAGGDLVPFRLEVSESPARVCFFEDTQPVCSTAARIEAGKLIAQWDYLRRELRLEIAGGGLQGVYHSLRTGSDLAVQAKPHQPPSRNTIGSRQKVAVDGRVGFRIGDGQGLLARPAVVVRRVGWAQCWVRRVRGGVEVIDWLACRD